MFKQLQTTIMDAVQLAAAVPPALGAWSTSTAQTTGNLTEAVVAINYAQGAGLAGGGCDVEAEGSNDNTNWFPVTVTDLANGTAGVAESGAGTRFRATTYVMQYRLPTIGNLASILLPVIFDVHAWKRWRIRVREYGVVVDPGVVTAYLAGGR